jgi:DNA-binding protein H-NS
LFENEVGKNFGSKAVSKFDLKSLSIDELWALHEEVGALLSGKILKEKQALETRLARLNGGSVEKPKMARAALKIRARRKVSRKYPPVLPKYRNPGNPTETWAGRGKQPRWLVSQLKAGKKINDFLISRNKRLPIAKRRAA